MKYIKLLTTLGLAFMWLIYFCFEIISGRITNITSFITNIILLILFIVLGYIIYHISKKYSSGINNKKILLLTFLFLLIDQIPKIIIKFYYFNYCFDIIKNSISFNPIINTNGSWLNARFGTSLSFSFLITTNIFFIFLIFEIYRYISSYTNKNFFIDLTFIFLLCGSICSLIDKLFYGGSLDYIAISNLFIADIKDIYINLGLYFFILSAYNCGYFNSKDSNIKDDYYSLLKFINFCIKDIKNIFTNKKKDS